MKRPYIDQEVRKQVKRLDAVLRDVDRSGGRDRWSHLFSHGHRFPTILSAVRKLYLDRDGHEFTLTAAGVRYIADVDRALANGTSE